MSEPGVFADGLVETVDIYPTLAELCGLTPPDSLSGESIVPLLEDPSHPGKDGAFGYWNGRRTLRTERYRITQYESDEPRFELFDHETDPFETVNVAGENPDMVEELSKLLQDNAPALSAVRN
jgi:arylsulfatase A-like enzyme